MRSLPRSVLPLLYLKTNTYPWRLLCRRPSLNWPSSVVIESDSGKLMPRIGPRMISWGKELNHQRNVLPRYETGSAVLSMCQGFEWPAPFFLSHLDVMVAIWNLLLWRRHIMLSLLLSTTHRRKRSRPRTWQIMPLLVLIVLLTSTLMLSVPAKPSVMEPLIDSEATLKRAADTKAILRELQDDLAACMAFSICFSF